MPGYKSSWTGTLANSDILDYLQKQSIMVFTTTGARDTALSGQLREGMFCYISGTNTTYWYDGSAWIPWDSPWTSVTPTFNNLTVADATVTGRYRYLAGDMLYRGRLTFGSSTSISAGVEVVIPNSETAAAVNSLGASYARDDNLAIDYSGISLCQGGVTVFALYAENDNITATAPFTWATDDVMAWQILIALS